MIRATRAQLIKAFNNRLDIAAGIQLDRIGAVVEVERRGAPDALYREVIRAKVTVGLAVGTVEETFNSLGVLLVPGLPCPGCGRKWHHEAGAARCGACDHPLSSGEPEPPKEPCAACAAEGGVCSDHMPF